MTKLVVDDRTSRTLRSAHETVELFDENGLPLGLFTPANQNTLYQQIQIPYSAEELAQLATQSGGRPLAEIIADLEKRQ